jgi:CHASE3 domain sensor protein
VSGGLTRRMAVASGLLALVVSAAFVVLLISVEDLRTSERLALHSQEVLTAANQLERLVVDVETGQRGFVITGKERFLAPWRDARMALPEASQRLEQLTAGDRQHEQAERMGRAAAAYVQDYSVPLVNAARRDPDSVRTEAATDEGRQKTDAIRPSSTGWSRPSAAWPWPVSASPTPPPAGRSWPPSAAWPARPCSSCCSPAT